MGAATSSARRAAASSSPPTPTSTPPPPNAPKRLPRRRLGPGPDSAASPIVSPHRAPTTLGPVGRGRPPPPRGGRHCVPKPAPGPRGERRDPNLGGVGVSRRRFLAGAGGAWPWGRWPPAAPQVPSRAGDGGPERPGRGRPRGHAAPPRRPGPRLHPDRAAGHGRPGRATVSDVGLQRHRTGPADPGHRRRRAAGPGRQWPSRRRPGRRGELGALARHRDPQRHGRRPRPHPTGAARRAVAGLRVHRPEPGHLLVPPARRGPVRPGPARPADHRRPPRARRLRRRVRGRPRRLDRRHQPHPRRRPDAPRTRSWPGCTAPA